MELKSKQLIIIGGGSSRKDGVDTGLYSKLNNKFTIGLNHIYKFFDSTCLMFVDNDFYTDNIENMNKLPLIIGKVHDRIKPMTNLITLKTTTKYTRDLTKGVYKNALVGLFALSLGIYLLDEGEIFLLGFDQGEIDKDKKDSKSRLITHCNQDELKHRGLGKVNYYHGKNRAERDFSVYIEEKKIKIYNVSPKSRIPDTVFEKITYQKFYEMLTYQIYSQDYIRNYIREKLEGLK